MQSAKLLLLSLLLIGIEQVVPVSSQFLPEDASLDTMRLATKYKHPPTQYEVVTEDGYILTMYRLPGKSKIPVLLVHGLGDSSDTWLLRGSTSLAITLANDGYDVWLANCRGNRYSRRHRRLNPDTDSDFWCYSFHEIGYYDLPAMIDAVLKFTGAKNVTAIGHSQGTTIFYVLGSERSDYNSKINVMLSLAPIAYLHHTPPPLGFLIEFYPLVDHLLSDLRVHEVGGDNTTSGYIPHTLCHLPVIGYILCINGVTFPFTGYDSEELEPQFSRVYATHYPAGTSAKSIVHYLQVGYRKKFAQYDHGSEANLLYYGSMNPPVYRLDRVTMPIALFAAANDHFSTLPDVDILKKQLANVVYYEVNSRSLCNHLDFVLGRNVREYLFPHIYQVLEKHNHF